MADMEYHKIQITFNIFVYIARPCEREVTPCQNGGTCNPAGDDYSCKCPPGWEDKDCDKGTVTIK